MADEALQAFLKDFAGGVTEPELRTQLRAETERRMELKYAGKNQTTIPQASILTTGNIGKVTPEPKFTGVSTPSEVFKSGYSSYSGGGSSRFKVRAKPRRSRVNKKGSVSNSRASKPEGTAGSGRGKATLHAESSGKKTRKNPIWLKKWQFKAKKK